MGTMSEWHAWRVSSPDGTRYVRHDGTVWTADPDTWLSMRAGAGQPVPVAPMGELYEPSSPTDPVGLYLLARRLVPGPVRVTGEPPAVPELEGWPAGTGIVH